MAGSRRDYEMAIKIAGEIEKSFPNAVKATKSELRAIAREAASSSGSMGMSFRDGINQTQPMFDKMGRVAKKAFKTVATAASAASVGIGAFAVNTGMEYEAQMSTVRALSQASEKDMLELNQTAQHLGATTVWTAKQSGEAMEYMAMAGWDAKQMVDAVPATMDLASASGEDLASVTDIVTDSMTAFSLKADEAGHFTDVLAATATSSNTNVGKLGESFKYAAPLAGSLGYNIEDTAFSLGLMANAGIKASQAGTSIRSWLTRMAKPTEESGAAMKKLGLSLKDSHGKMKPLREMIDQTRDSFKGLSKSQKAEYAAMLAGKTGMSGLLAVVNSTDADYQKLRQSIDDCNGAAKEMAEIKLDNLEGDVTLFKSAMDGAGMEIYNEIKEPLREVVSAGTKWVGDFAKDFKKNFPTIRRLVIQAGEAVGNLADPLLSVGGWLLDHPDVISGTIAGIGTALLTYKVVSGISSLATSLTSLGTGGAAVLGIAGAVGVIGGISAAIAQAKKVAKDASLDEHFGDIALNMEEIQSISKEIVGAKKLARVSELLDSMSKSEGFADELKEANSTIKKMDWKVSAGLKLSDTDKSDYESSVRQYVSSAQDLIDQNGYEVTIATSLLFEDSPEKTQLLKNSDYFYKELDGEVQDLSEKIDEKLQEGIKKGFSPDLQEEINGLLNEMSEITNALTEAETEASWNALEAEWSGKDLDADSFKNLQKEVQKNVDELKSGAKEAYNTEIVSLSAQKKLGYIDDTTYQGLKQKSDAAYQETIAEAEERGQSFLYNTAMDTYGEKMANPDSMSAEEEAGAKELFDAVAKINPGSSYGINAAAIGHAFDDDWRSAAGSFLEEFQVSFGVLDETTNDSLRDTATKLANDYLKEKGKPTFFDSLATSIETGAKLFGENSGLEVSPEVQVNDDSVDITPVTEKIKGDFKEQLESGVSADIPINATGFFQSPKFLFGATGTGEVKKHANGGIFSTPHIGMVAEAGYEEAIIPIDGSANAYNLLNQTAQMLGVSVGADSGLSALASQILVLNNEGGASSSPAGNQSSQPVVVQYSPNITIEGNADKETIESVLNDEYEKFKRYMKQWEKDGGRLSLT